MDQEIRLDPFADDAILDLRGPDARIELRPRDGRPISADTTGLPGAPVWKRALKRTMDLAGATAALVLLSPLFLLVSVAIALDSRGPVFFVQTRVGRDGRPFRMVKFRSMVAGAHDRRHEHAHLNHHDGHPVFKIREDPRVTRVGRLIRRWSVDELPQLLNVLTGSMSLVGPRPCLPEEYALYDARAARRLLVKPGITCIWQVSGRSDVEFDRWMEMDFAYIRSWSLTLDLTLLLKTVPAVLRGHGAY